MTIEALSIPEPCPVAWSSMEGDERRRFCAQCDKHVTHLSTMTKREATEFLLDNEDVCVQMDTFDGEILFTPELRSSKRLSRGWMKRAVAIGASLTLAAPALASGKADSPGSLVEWVASWWATESTDNTPVEPEQQVQPPVSPPPRFQPLGGAPRVSPAMEAERERRRNERARNTPVTKPASTNPSMIPEVSGH